MSALQVVLGLGARFEQHHASYTAGNYNETRLRRKFLDPFFKALSWDVDNEHGYAETYKAEGRNDDNKRHSLVVLPHVNIGIIRAVNPFPPHKKHRRSLTEEPFFGYI